MRRYLTFFVFVLSLSTFALAEKVLIPLASQGDSQLQVPSLRMTQAEVLAKFGAPVEKSAPVGSPPISKWTYKDFTVYFESRYVIRSVKHFTRQSDNTAQ